MASKKLKPKEPKRQRPKRPPEQGNLQDISRWARVINTGEFLFEVRFGKREGENKAERYKFRREDAVKYSQPIHGSKVRCIYHGNKYHTFPHKVYSRFNELLYEEKSNSI